MMTEPQLKPFTLSMQEAPFRHGLEAHSSTESIAIEQLLPV
jgi:hypothetical protein